MVAGCAIRQRNILRVAAKLVRPGGYLLYSTCTFAPEEDEQVIATLLDEFPEYEVWPLEGFPGFMRGRPDWLEQNKKQKTKETLSGAVRLFPQRVNGEGHFACMLKRAEGADGVAGWSPDRLESPSNVQERLWLAFAGEALKTGFEADRLRVRGERLYFIPENMPGFGNLRVVHPGVWLGTFKKERFEPAHPLALFLEPGRAQNVLDLSSMEEGGQQDSGMGGHRPPLRAYLGGESLPAEGTPGWTLVSVDGWPLGWGKRVQGVVKNHYPRGWQIY
jgi:NOL1/NOP2/fmu family ribosome biogenesis protein